MQQDLSKWAVKGQTSGRKVECKNPDAPASFKQRKMLAAIYSANGMKFDFSSAITMGEASAIIDEGVKTLKPRQTATKPTVNLDALKTLFGL